MENAFPFFSNHPDDAGSTIYHTHPRCRVGQRVPKEARTIGTGDSRGECPFCFLLAQFQANRGLRGRMPPGVPPLVGASSSDNASQPLRTFGLNL